MKHPLFLPVIILLALLSFAADLPAQDTPAATALYVCPMHPNEKSDKPGKCGICGMDLVKSKERVIAQKSDERMTNVPAPLTEPTHRKRVDKYDIRCWVMPKSECAAACGMEMKKEQGAKEGTHCVMVSVRTRNTKKPIDKAEVWFHIIYPGKRNLMPKLANRGEVYAGEIDLSEKGRYTMMTHVTVGEKNPVMKFKYRVK